MKITFKINNETLNGYMGENLIIKNNSVLVDCQSIDQLLVFENSYVKRFKQITKKFEGKFLTHSSKLELNLFNLSKLNYFHSRTILEKIDFLNEFKKILLKDDFHFKENSQDKLFYVNSSSIFTRVAKSLTSFSNFIGFYVKIIFYSIVLFVIVWVSFKLELYLSLIKLFKCMFTQLLKSFTFTFSGLRTCLNYIKSKQVLKKKERVVKEKSLKIKEENIELEEMDFSAKNLTEIS